jgi:hypothetical protein
MTAILLLVFLVAIGPLALFFGTDTRGSPTTVAPSRRSP